MANSVGSSDPSTKVDNESTTGQANANEWGNAPAGPVDAFGFPLDSKQKTADTAAEEPPAEEPPAEEPPAEELSAEAPPAEEPPAEAPPAEETPAEALPAEEPYAEAPPAVAPANLPKLKPKGNCVVVMTDPKGNCVVVMTDPKGNTTMIGYLWAIEDREDCIIQLGKRTENRETSLTLCARFPRFGSDNDATVEQFQRIWFYFYGDSFETFESDFVITEVNEVEELPHILTARGSVLEAVGNNLHKLQLTYKPEKVVTKGKDDPDDFLKPGVSWSAEMFRYLVEGETPKTLTLYFIADPATLHALNAIRDRLEYEMIVKPSVEYRNKNGKIVLVIEVLVYQPKPTVSVFNMARFWPRRQHSYKTAKAA